MSRTFRFVIAAFFVGLFGALSHAQGGLSDWQADALWCVYDRGPAGQKYQKVCKDHDQFDSIVACQRTADIASGPQLPRIYGAGRKAINQFMQFYQPASCGKGLTGSIAPDEQTGAVGESRDSDQSQSSPVQESPPPGQEVLILDEGSIPRDEGWRPTEELPEEERAARAISVAIVQRALAQRNEALSPGYIYKKLWHPEASKKCGDSIYCQESVRLDSLVSVVFHKPLIGEMKSFVEGILKQSISKLYDRQIVVHLPQKLLLICRSSDLRTHLHSKEIPPFYVVVGFYVNNPPYGDDVRASPISILNGLLLLDPWRMSYVSLGLQAPEILSTLQNGTMVIGEQSEKTGSLSSLTFASAEDVKQAQLQFQKKMTEITSGYAARAAKIPTVESPTGGMMMLSGNGAYRAEDLAGLWTETKRLPIKASTTAGLSGMSAYIVKFLPQYPNSTTGTVSIGKGRAFIETLGSFVSKINGAASNIATNITFKSSPEPAVLSLATEGGMTLPNVPSPTLITNIYRGWYTYDVQESGSKKIAKQELNLIDQDITELDCHLVALSERREALPCFQKVQK